MNKVLALDVQRVIFVPIAADSQNSACALLNGHHIRQGNPRLFFLLVLVFKTGQVQVNVKLKNAEPVILNRRHALLFGLLLLNVVQLKTWLTQLHITIEPSILQLQYFVLSLTHHMRNTGGIFNTGCAVGHNDVFSGDKHGDLPPFIRVVVHLLERRACQGQ